MDYLSGQEFSGTFTYSAFPLNMILQLYHWYSVPRASFVLKWDLDRRSFRWHHYHTLYISSDDNNRNNNNFCWRIWRFPIAIWMFPIIFSRHFSLSIQPYFRHYSMNSIHSSSFYSAYSTLSSSRIVYPNFVWQFVLSHSLDMFIAF